MQIRQLRIKANLTQQELAILIDVTNDTVSRWEKGKHSPASQKVIARLLKAFNCTYEDLMK